MSAANEDDEAVSAANEDDDAVSGADEDQPASGADDATTDGATGTDGGAEDDGATEDTRPRLRIVRGDPSPEDIAALTVVLAAASGGAAPEEAGPRSVWTDRSRLVRRPVHPSPGGWRASALPG